MKPVLWMCLAAACALPACAKGPVPDTVSIVDRANPVQSYTMTADLSTVPGKPPEVFGYVNYENKWSGTPCPSEHMARWEIRVPWQRRDIEMKEVSPGVYEGVFHLDQIEDRAYFERGMCSWRLNTVGISFEGAGGRGFGAGLNYLSIDAGKEGLSYYYTEDWSAPIGESGIGAAREIPTDLYKDNPDNEYASNPQKYFPVKVRVAPTLGAPGLGVREEFKARTGEDPE